MKAWRKSVAGMFVFGAGALASVWGLDLVRDAQFARAQEQVETSREQLQQVEDLANVFRQVSKAVEPSVVKIKIIKSSRTAFSGMPFGEEQLREFFPDQDGDGEPDLPEQLREMPQRPQEGTGSGVIIELKDKGAYILTNNHVAGDADEMEITLNDGRTIKNAKLVGADPKSDLALLEVEADRLIAAKWGNSDELQKGDWILAFGSPFGYVGSMTHGIVSATGRHNIGILGPMGYENFIQVDAPINPGNSGGPLVNIRGEVVGINTAIASMTGGSVGIGFAIPANQVKDVFTSLRDKGKVVRGYLGIGIDDVSGPRNPNTPMILESIDFKGTDGIVVVTIEAASPSTDKLRVGDVITKINDKDVKDVNELRKAVAATEPGAEMKLGVVRDGDNETIAVKIGEQPEMVASAGGRPNRAQPRKQSGIESLGIKLSDLTDELATKHELTERKDDGGALVTSVTSGSPADREGLRPGDVIVKVGKDRVKTAQEAIDALAKHDLVKGVALYVVNKDQQKLVIIRTAPRR